MYLFESMCKRARSHTHTHQQKPVSIKSLNKSSLPAINPEAVRFIAFQQQKLKLFFIFVRFLLFACYLINKISWVKHVYERVCARVYTSSFDIHFIFWLALFIVLWHIPSNRYIFLAFSAYYMRFSLRTYYLSA